MIFFLLLATDGFSLDNQALEILTQTAAYYQALKNFSATYDLIICYPGIEAEADTVFTSKMTLIVQGEQYRLYDDHYEHKETVTDGETIWVYDQVLNEVTMSTYDQTDCGIEYLISNLHNLYQQGYQAVYKGRRVVDGVKHRVREVVALFPIAEEALVFQYMTLEIDPLTFQIHGWEILQDDYTRYVGNIGDFAVNLSLPQDYFTFNPNAHGDDLTVIDLREDEVIEDEENMA